MGIIWGSGWSAWTYVREAQCLIFCLMHGMTVRLSHTVMTATSVTLFVRGGSDMSDVVLNCAECGAYGAVAIPSAQTTGVVSCLGCGAAIDVAHAYAHAPWCGACGEDLSECGCDTPDRFAVSDALITLDRIVAGLSAPVREGSAEDVDPDGFRSALAESLADIHDRIARALGLGDPS